MKKATFIATFLCFSFWPINAQTSNDVVNSFFEALNSKNPDLLNDLCLEDMKLHSLSLGKDMVLTSQSKQGFIEGIKSIPKETTIFEKITSTEAIVKEHLAQYTLPYLFYVNDKLSHSGTNVITLLNTDDGWKISYIADTRERP